MQKAGFFAVWKEKMAKKSFETSLAQLEETVKELESGRLPLEKAVKLFEKGMNLSKFCLEKLDETEKKITILMKDSKGNTIEEPFDHE